MKKIAITTLIALSILVFSSVSIAGDHGGRGRGQGQGRGMMNKSFDELPDDMKERLRSKGVTNDEQFQERRNGRRQQKQRQGDQGFNNQGNNIGQLQSRYAGSTTEQQIAMRDRLTNVYRDSSTSEDKKVQIREFFAQNPYPGATLSLTPTSYQSVGGVR